MPAPTAPYEDWSQPQYTSRNPNRDIHSLLHGGPSAPHSPSPAYTYPSSSSQPIAIRAGHAPSDFHPSSWSSSSFEPSSAWSAGGFRTPDLPADHAARSPGNPRRSATEGSAAAAHRSPSAGPIPARRPGGTQPHRSYSLRSPRGSVADASYRGGREPPETPGALPIPQARTGLSPVVTGMELGSPPVFGAAPTLQHRASDASAQSASSAASPRSLSRAGPTSPRIRSASRRSSISSDRGARSPTRVQLPIGTRTPAEPVKCFNCDETFNSHLECNAHMVEAHLFPRGGFSSPPEPRSPLPESILRDAALPGGVDPRKCSECDKVFRTAPECTLHMTTHLLEKVGIEAMS